MRLHWKTFPLLRALAALAMSAVACDGAVTEPPIDGPFVGLYVVGSVRTADGGPVTGASLNVWARGAGSCTGGYADGRAVTDTAGSFLSDLHAWNNPKDVCVWIEVVPPAESGLAPVTMTFQPARLDLEADTLEVTIVLPGPPASP